MPFVRVPLPLAFQVIIEFNETGLNVQSFRALVQTAVPLVTNRMVSERVPVEAFEYGMPIGSSTISFFPQASTMSTPEPLMRSSLRSSKARLASCMGKSCTLGRMGIRAAISRRSIPSCRVLAVTLCTFFS